MATEFNTGADASLNAAVKSRYEANADTNAFTDAEKAKLAAIEAGASADQTGAEIVTAVNAELGGTTWQSGGGGAGGTVDVVSNVAQGRILGRVSAGSGNSEELTAADVRALLDAPTNAGLAATAAGQGASLVGIEDAGAYTAQATVEGALQEIYGVLGGHGDIVAENSANFVRQTEREVIVFDAGGDPNAVRPAQAANKTVIWFNHGAAQPANMGAFDIAAGQELGVSDVNTQTGLAYTLAASDAGFSVDMDNAAANTVTIPTAATVAYPVGTIISITQLGAGVTSIQGAAGVTLNGAVAGSVSINSRFSGVAVRKIGADVWIAQGDFT